MERLIGNIPLIRRLFPDRGWYRREYSPETLSGPYPTDEAARIRLGDPIPPYEIDYHLIMPVGSHDIRKPVEFKWS